MKILLNLILVLLCVSANAASVRIYFQNRFTLANDTNYILVTAVDTNVLSSGGVSGRGVTKRYTPPPNGYLTNTLAVGHYSLENPTLGTKVLIRVPDTSDFYDYTNLLISGFNTFVTIEPTAAGITNALGYVPATNGVSSGGSATNVTMRAGTGTEVTTNSTSDWTVSLAVTNNTDLAGKATGAGLGTNLTSLVQRSNGGATNLSITGPLSFGGFTEISKSGTNLMLSGGDGDIVLSSAGSTIGNALGLTNGSPNLATNSATATDGQALVKRGDRLKLETISGGSGTTYTNNSGSAGYIVGSGIGTNVPASQVVAIMGTNSALNATNVSLLGGPVAGSVPFVASSSLGQSRLNSGSDLLFDSSLHRMTLGQAGDGQRWGISLGDNIDDDLGTLFSGRYLYSDKGFAITNGQPLAWIYNGGYYSIHAPQFHNGIEPIDYQLGYEWNAAAWYLGSWGEGNTNARFSYIFGESSPTISMNLKTDGTNGIGFFFGGSGDSTLRRAFSYYKDSDSYALGTNVRALSITGSNIIAQVGANFLMISSNAVTITNLTVTGTTTLADLNVTQRAIVQNLAQPTNTWEINTAIGMGTNAYYTGGAQTLGVTGVADNPTNSIYFGELELKPTGDIIFTNPVSFKASDYAITRTFTNGNSVIVSVRVKPGVSTNLTFVQFR